MALIGLVLLLVMVRTFEARLFYDPFYEYFKGDYLNLAFPDFDGLTLFFSMTLRYWLNTFFSLAIIQVLFKERQLTVFTSVLYAVFFIVLIASFFVLVLYSDSHNNFILFYIRRFLIQPLFLLLFVPAFYYQQLQAKK